MDKNYYDLLIENIESLIKEKKEDQAIKLIEEEFKLPYIPIQYEQKLKSIYSSIVKPLDKQQKIHTFSREEIINILTTEYNQHSVNFLIEIASMMEQYNWLNNLNDISQILTNKQLDSKVRCTIYNILVVQQINFDFKIEDKTINPILNKTTFETEFFIKNISSLSNDAQTEPSIREIATKIFFFYIMNQFPQCLFFESKDITKQLINIANVMIGQKTINDLDLEEKEIYSHIKSQ